MPKSTLAIAVVVCLFALERSTCAQGWSFDSLFGRGTSAGGESLGPGDPFLAAEAAAGPIAGPARNEDELTWVTLNRSDVQLVEHSEPYGSDSSVGRATFNSMEEPFTTTENHALQDVGYSTLDLLPQEFPPTPPVLPAPEASPSIFDLIMKEGGDFRWEPRKNGFGVLSFWGGFQVPVVPAMKVFGSPPPMVAFNFGYTDLQGIGNFYSFSIGLNWYRPVNDRWAWYFSVQPLITTDLKNTSGDMWRVKANVFAFYTVNPELTWSFGVLVTGRNDIPVLPLIGVVWYPDERTKFDITFPRPRIYHMLSGDAQREQWFYVGGELGGGTWGYQAPNGFNDILTYRSYRFACGVEFVPAGSKLPGASVAGARTYVEAGLSFSRNVSLDRLDVDMNKDNVFYLGGGLQF